MGIWSTIGSIVGTYFGGPTGGQIGGAIGGHLDANDVADASAGAQAQANAFNSAEAAKNREWQGWMASTGYQRAMGDMRAAGLNPMLAYSQGPAGVPGGGQATYPTGAGPSFVTASAAAQSSNASMVSAGAASQQANTASSIGEATINKIKQEIVNLKTDNERGNAVIENLRVEYQNLVKQGYNLTEVGNHMRAMIDKMRVEIPFINSQTFLNDAKENLTKIQAALGNMDLDAARDFSNLGREAQQLKPIFDILRIFVPKNLGK